MPAGLGGLPPGPVSNPFKPFPSLPISMSLSLFLTQALNGLQLGVLLFLLAAGLTLVFGIMNFVNLAHGSLYMMGAYFAAAVFNWTGSFVLAGLIGVPATMLLGIVVERVALTRLYHRDHL